MRLRFLHNLIGASEWKNTIVGKNAHSNSSGRRFDHLRALEHAQSDTHTLERPESHLRYAHASNRRQKIGYFVAIFCSLCGQLDKCLCVAVVWKLCDWRRLVYMRHWDTETLKHCMWTEWFDLSLPNHQLNSVVKMRLIGHPSLVYLRTGSFRIDIIHLGIFIASRYSMKERKKNAIKCIKLSRTVPSLTAETMCSHYESWTEKRKKNESNSKTCYSVTYRSKVNIRTHTVAMPRM